MKITKEPPVMPVNLRLSAETLWLGVGLSDTVSILYDEYPRPDVTRFNWVSSHPDIAAVTGGMITGLKPGRTTVSLTGPEGVLGTVGVTVSESLPLISPWSVIRPSALMTPHIGPANRISIQTEAGGLWASQSPIGGSNRNFHVMDVPGDLENVTIEVKLIFEPVMDFHKAALTFHNGDDNIVSVHRRHHSYYGFNCFMTSMNVNRTPDESIADAVPDTLGPVCYLRLVKNGSVFRGYYSEDGVNWAFISSKTHYGLGSAPSLRVGFYAVNGGGATGTSSITAVFEDFKLNGEVIPFAEAVEPIRFGHVLDRDVITVADAALVFRNILGLISLTDKQREAAAVGGGSEPTIADVLRIFRYALGLSPQI
jgi:hypothetical protein